MANSSKLPGWPQTMTPPFTGLADAFGDPAAGANPLTQTLASGMELMKNMWGQMPSGVPGFVVPTLDLAELDKRIADLRAVEGWLELNANMLKATIQGLEVQRHTVAALKALQTDGNPLMAMFGNQVPSQNAAASGLPNHHWPMPTATAPAMAQAPSPLPVRPEPQPGHAATGKKASRAPAKVASAAPLDAPAIGAAAVESANMWMNFLKNQFSQIAGATLAPGPASANQDAAATGVGKSAGAAPKKRVKKRAAARRALSSKR